MENQLVRSEKLLTKMRERRSVRAFSDKRIPRQVIENCIAVAGSAPSGANMQPWTFVLVEDKKVKEQIRRKAEKIEKEFYESKVSDEQKRRLAPLKVDWQKAFITEVPYLICVFVQNHGIEKNGIIKHYYPRESVGIAVGFLISALHQLGIASLPYTPAPMVFLSEILARPSNEKPFMIIAAGYKSEAFSPPDIEKKELDDIMQVI
jgi:iodotyrosine deiodinase